MRKGEERQILESIASLPNLNDWETQFIESLSDQLDNGRELTERQRTKLIEIYESKVLGY